MEDLLPEMRSGMSTKTQAVESNGKDVKQQIFSPRRLDIACGQNKQQGFKGIDIAGDADIVWDLNEIPWPIRTSSVREAYCAHYVEHIPHERPGWDRDGWFRFFDELYRVMAGGATAQFIHPYSRHDRAFWDPTHVRFINETTWYYLDKQWREMQGLDHYPVECDFEIITVDAIGLSNEFMSRSADTQNFARAHYFNVIPDLRALLKSRKG
jgi:predicted SAM-dependent methyltransferase